MGEITDSAIAQLLNEIELEISQAQATSQHEPTFVQLLEDTEESETQT